MTARPRAPAGEAGFTLIELMISLGLFALIAVAGLGLVQSILGVQGRTEARLDRLAQLQRAMFVVTSDLDQIARGPITGDAGAIAFTRAAPGIGGAPVSLRYDATGGALVRWIGAAPQPVLPGVTAVRWRYWDGEWADRWPARDAADAADPGWPRAVELRVEAGGAGLPGGVLRRVVVLPAQPREAGR